MDGTRIIHLQFHDVFYEIRVTNGTIKRINEYYATNQYEREVVFNDLPRHVKLAIVDAILDDERANEC